MLKETTPTQRLIAYGVMFAAGIGLLVYGAQMDMESVREIAAGLIGAAVGGAGMRQVKR